MAQTCQHAQELGLLKMVEIKLHMRQRLPRNANKLSLHATQHAGNNWDSCVQKPKVECAHTLLTHNVAASSANTAP